MRKKPYEQHVLEGTLRAERHHPGVSGGVGEYDPTFKLSRRAKAEWERIRAFAYWIREADAGALSERCQVFARLREVEADIDARGTLLKGHRGHQILNPSVRLARSLRDQLSKFDAQLGLNPTARAGLQLPPEPSNEMDAIEAALCGGLPMDPIERKIYG